MTVNHVATVLEKIKPIISVNRIGTVNVYIYTIRMALGGHIYCIIGTHEFMRMRGRKTQMPGILFCLKDCNLVFASNCSYLAVFLILLYVHVQRRVMSYRSGYCIAGQYIDPRDLDLDGYSQIPGPGVRPYQLGSGMCSTQVC
jgi:hypothetical protein